MTKQTKQNKTNSYILDIEISDVIKKIEVVETSIAAKKESIIATGRWINTAIAGKDSPTEIEQARREIREYESVITSLYNELEVLQNNLVLLRNRKKGQIDTQMTIDFGCER